MKIELYVDNKHPQINSNVTYLHLTQIQNIDNAICTQIKINNCLDYALERDQLLSIIVDKLRYNGILSISGVDLDEVIHCASIGLVTTEELIQLLYAGKMSADTYDNIIQKLVEKKLTIEHQNIDNYQYFVTAIRKLPNN